MKLILNLVLFFTVLSCSSRNEDYKMLNDFVMGNNIQLENLSDKPFYLENALSYWGEKEFKKYNFNIPRNEKYNLDVQLIANKTKKIGSNKETRISMPLISTDGDKALVAVQEKWGSQETLTIYLLSRKDSKWNVVTNIKSVSTLSH